MESGIRTRVSLTTSSSWTFETNALGSVPTVSSIPIFMDGFYTNSRHILNGQFFFRAKKLKPIVLIVLEQY
jgi:hypothetical protein